MDEFRSKGQAHPFRLCLGKNLAQRLKRGRMRMANRNGLPFFPGAPQSQFQLFPHCANFGNVIEKRNIAKR